MYSFGTRESLPFQHSLLKCNRVNQGANGSGADAGQLRSRSKLCYTQNTPACTLVHWFASARVCERAKAMNVAGSAMCES